MSDPWWARFVHSLLYSAHKLYIIIRIVNWLKIKVVHEMQHVSWQLENWKKHLKRKFKNLK